MAGVVVDFGFTVVTAGGRSFGADAGGKSTETPENNEKVNESLRPENVFYRSI